MPSKMSDERLLSSFKRASTELGRIDVRVERARKTLEEHDETRAKAQATIDNADADRDEVQAQLAHLRTIAKNRNVNLDEMLETEEPPVQQDGQPVAQPAPGAPAFAQGY